MFAVKVGEQDSRWSCEQRVLDHNTDPESAAGVDPDVRWRRFRGSEGFRV